MTNTSDIFFSRLVSDLHPVRPLSFVRGLSYALGAAIMSALSVIVMFGFRADLMSGRFDQVYLIATGLFLVLGIAAAVTVILMSRPQVGNVYRGWMWAAAMVALLPIVAVMAGLGGGNAMLSGESVAHGLECLVIGSGSSLLVFAILVGWLRKGAPTSPDRAGLLTGIAAGSLGIFAFSLHCADNGIVHIGLWHSGVVLLMAAIGRALVPPLVRW